MGGGRRGSGASEVQNRNAAHQACVGLRSPPTATNDHQQHDHKRPASLCVRHGVGVCWVRWRAPGRAGLPVAPSALAAWLRSQAEGDREVMEKSSRAFVSLVRGYKEHHCKFVFRLQVRTACCVWPQHYAL